MDYNSRNFLPKCALQNKEQLCCLQQRLKPSVSPLESSSFCRARVWSAEEHSQGVFPSPITSCTVARATELMYLMLLFLTICQITFQERKVQRGRSKARHRQNESGPREDVESQPTGKFAHRLCSVMGRGENFHNLMSPGLPSIPTPHCEIWTNPPPPGAPLSCPSSCGKGCPAVPRGGHASLHLGESFAGERTSEGPRENFIASLFPALLRANTPLNIHR